MDRQINGSCSKEKWQAECVYIGLPEPAFELRGGPQSKQRPQIKRIVERRALVIEHHVVRSGHAHDVVHARRSQQREQRVHVVLIGLGVVCVTDVAAHRQSQQLAAKMVFEPGAGDLLDSTAAILDGWTLADARGQTSPLETHLGASPAKKARRRSSVKQSSSRKGAAKHRP